MELAKAGGLWPYSTIGAGPMSSTAARCRVASLSAGGHGQELGTARGLTGLSLHQAQVLPAGLSLLKLRQPLNQAGSGPQRRRPHRLDLHWSPAS